MFKYGSFRNFVVRFSLGVFLFSLGLTYFASLYSYSSNDPGFNQFNSNIDVNNIENFVGFFGSYLSSYSLIFIGTLSYLLAFFMILEGGKLFLGINSRLLILKFLFGLIGIIFINTFLKSVNVTFLKTGLISQFLIDLFTSINLNFLENVFYLFSYKFFTFDIWYNIIFLIFSNN
jgi:hypothetical protein